jgi:2-polyprenyl-6-methoxyphenol hydroxylase-like FAD-dependent oxidoreductase
MKLIGKRYSYPMITTYSKKFVANRFALIGDAAVGMHPVTAHGFNLGLKGLEVLTKEIKFAINAILTLVHLRYFVIINTSFIV